MSTADNSTTSLTAAASEHGMHLTPLAHQTYACFRNHKDELIRLRTDRAIAEATLALFADFMESCNAELPPHKQWSKETAGNYQALHNSPLSLESVRFGLSELHTARSSDPIIAHVIPDASNEDLRERRAIHVAVISPSDRRDFRRSASTENQEATYCRSKSYANNNIYISEMAMEALEAHAQTLETHDKAQSESLHCCAHCAIQ